MQNGSGPNRPPPHPTESGQLPTLVGLGGLIVVFYIWLLPATTEGLRPLDLFFRYDVHIAREVLERMGPNVLKKYRIGLTVVDSAFPIVYSSFLGLLLLRIWQARWVLALPVLLMLLDFGENFSILKLVDTFPELSAADTWRASAFSSAKWIAVMMNFTAIALGIFVRSRRKSTARNWQ